MDIALNFINKSDDTAPAEIVIFSRNVATGPSEIPLAWLVFSCAPGGHRPFAYPVESSIAFGDSYGNRSQPIPAMPGEQFVVVGAGSGDTIRRSGNAGAPDEIVLVNGLAKGAISVAIYKDGRVFASVNEVVPQQKAVFKFAPTIWIGTIAQAEQGQVMDEAVVSAVNTEISLLGIRSADIVMTGGGAGAQAVPYVFTLQNVVMA